MSISRQTGSHRTNYKTLKKIARYLRMVISSENDVLMCFSLFPTLWMGMELFLPAIEDAIQGFWCCSRSCIPLLSISQMYSFILCRLKFISWIWSYVLLWFEVIGGVYSWNAIFFGWLLLINVWIGLGSALDYFRWRKLWFWRGIGALVDVRVTKVLLLINSMKVGTLVEICPCYLIIWKLDLWFAVQLLIILADLDNRIGFFGEIRSRKCLAS